MPHPLLDYLTKPRSLRHLALSLTLFFFSLQQVAANPEADYRASQIQRQSDLQALEEVYYQGRVLDYWQGFTQFIDKNWDQMSPREAVETLRGVFELCFAAFEVECMFVTKLLMETPVEELRTRPDTVFGLPELYEAELEFMDMLDILNEETDLVISKLMLESGDVYILAMASQIMETQT